MEVFRSIAFVVLLSNFCYGDAENVNNVLLDLITNSTTSPPSPSRELTISELDYYVNTDEGIAALKEEFKNIKGGQRKPWTEALKPENIKKNRYEDLLAYDETRVKLQSYEGQTSDYINANYINGTNHQKEYIATQGPLETTANDFWAMVWQENVNKIVVLANLIEKGESKVFKYWPETNGSYGEITVQKLSEHAMGGIDHVVREFSLVKGNEGRTVRQFHYTGWPDLGVPKDRLSVVALMRQVRQYRRDTTQPIIIHCSAGVGRTGTVILMDSMLERARQEGVVNFPQRLDRMRLQRVDVVERPEQYVFAHHAVLDSFTPEAAEYLNDVDNMHRWGDTEPIRFHPVETTVQQLKWHNDEMSELIHALEQGFEKTDA